MKSSIYDYRDYKKYLNDLIDANGSRGKRKLLAEFIGCQVSHISGVLGGETHFNFEQAEAAARFFGLSAKETEFFLLMVQFVRAGTPSLKKFCGKLLDEHQEKMSALKARLKMPDSLSGSDEIRYYSSWIYAAIHVLLSIPEFQTRDALAKKLNLPLASIDEALSFLETTGLCKKEGFKFLLLRPLLHLDKNSPLISKHHTNWRLRSIISLDQRSQEDLHYSSVFTLAAKDFPIVREILSKALAEALQLITASDEEDAAVISLDLFWI